MRQEFVERLESIAVREFVNSILDEIGAPDAAMTLAAIAKARTSIRSHSDQIAVKLDALYQLLREFHLNRDATLGLRIREVGLALGGFGKKLGDLDEAFARTDLAVINAAIRDLKQIQLAVIRVEDTIRTMAQND